MIQKFVNKLIENLPDEYTKTSKPIKYDIVLGGGAFNGSCLIGALYFLKEMEKRNYIKIERISGCSIGSIVGLLYLTDNLDLMTSLYNYITKKFKKNHNLAIIKEIKDILKDHIPDNICEIVNNKLYICYNNIKLKKKEIKSKYKNTDHLFDIIIRSSFVPYLIDENIVYNGKYMDGVNPYIFEKRDYEIIFFDLYTMDKIIYFINIKNEKTNFHRVLTGLLEMHTFFIKGNSTPMCSYVNKWTLTERAFYYLKTFLERILICIVVSIVTFQKLFHKKLTESSILYKLFVQYNKEYIVHFLDKYCF
jgi:hypothetical protein